MAQKGTVSGILVQGKNSFAKVMQNINTAGSEHWFSSPMYACSAENMCTCYPEAVECFYVGLSVFWNEQLHSEHISSQLHMQRDVDGALDGIELEDLMYM